jgi:DNA-binding transcriptional MerR regulator
MPSLKDDSITKLYYSIGEVAKMFQVNNSLIRFWEKEFDILKPKKNAKGNRLFTQKDVDNLKIIFHLVKERGFTLDGAKKKLRENKTDSTPNEEIVERLKEIRGFLVELRDNL